jgi:hypothetical protein
LDSVLVLKGYDLLQVLDSVLFLKDMVFFRYWIRIYLVTAVKCFVTAEL